MGFKPATLIDVRDEGTSQGYVNAIDFAGAGVSAAVSGSVATVTISGGGGGGGTPGGSDTQVQFNDGGSFGGDTYFIWDKTNDKLYLQPVADAYPGSDPSVLQIVRTITTPPNTPPGAVNPLVGISGTFAQSGAVNQGRIGLGVLVSDDVSVVNKTITGAANNGSGLIRITATGHGFATSDRINIYGVLGTTEANGVWTITVIDANNFDLQSSTFSNAYTSGGTATNRGLFYAGHFNVAPTLDRGGLVGTGSNGDDVNPLSLVNSGPGKATDCIWITDGVASGPAFHTLLGSDSNTDYFINFYGEISTAGIDLSSATLATGSEPMISLGAGHNIQLDAATGTKIGTSTSQKLGFFNATPIVQNTSTADLRTGLINLGFFASGGASPLNLNGGVLTAAQAVVSTGTITASQPAVDITQTWNSGAVTFTGFKQNITNTASASASLLADFQVGGVSRWYLDNLGGVYQRAADGSSTATQWESHANSTTANTTINSIIAHQSAGTQADPKRTQAGQVVLRFSASGYTAVDDTTTAAKVAPHKAAVDLITGSGDWTTSDNGMYIRFRTTPDGSTTTAVRGFINDYGVTLGSALVARGTTNPTNALTLVDGTAPVGTLTNAVQCYSSSGDLYAMNASGTATRLTGSSGTYTPTNVTTDRSYDANSTTLDELADVLGTLIADLQTRGILA